MSHSIVYESWTFPADKIKEGNLYLATSLLASSLEVNSFAPVVECDDPSILDFQRNAKLLYYAEPGRPMVFRVQNIKRVGPNLYEISATSTLGLLTEGRHMGGIYTGQEAEEVILDICGTVPVEIKNVLKKIKLYGWLPIAAPRDNFAQVLFAIGATLKTDLDGVLRVEGLWDGISGQVPHDRMYTDANVDYSARITQVIVTEHQYVPWTEEKQLFEGTAQAGDIITFDEPMHSLSAQGFTIQTSGANWAQVSAGSGVLTGKTYLHNTRQISKAVQVASTPNVKTVEDITLVSLVNSQVCAQRLVDYYKCRELIDAPVVYQGENPGDRLATWHPFDKTGVAACLESADITLSNTLKAQEKLLVGYVPPQFEEMITYDNHEILTGSGSWSPPEGTTSVIAVLIGGGQAGTNGSNGTTGSGGSNLGDRTDQKYDEKTLTESSKSASLSASASQTATGYTNGNGGAGGHAGLPGKILRVEIKDLSGTSIPYSCGRGGSSNGAAGTETTFGDHSSAEGAVSQTGYTDTVTGITYARQGVNGTAGGDGGSEGADGASVNGVSGGRGYRGGSDPHTATRSYYDTGKATYTNIKASLNTQVSGIGGGGAGGNSGSASGQPGLSGTQAAGSVAITIASNRPRAMGENGRCTSGSGGDGANGASGATPGSAGSGGGGGGGAGAVSSTSVSVQASCDVVCYIASSPWTYNVKIQAWATGRNGYSGSPGNGGAGGAGAPGCIILYYGVQKKSPAGQLVDKQNRMVLDRLGRRIIM